MALGDVEPEAIAEGRIRLQWCLSSLDGDRADLCAVRRHHDLVREVVTQGEAALEGPFTVALRES